jgi:hypothetical protein
MATIDRAPFVSTRLNDEGKREQIRVECGARSDDLIEIADDRVTSRAEGRQVLTREVPSMNRVWLTDEEALFVRDALTELLELRGRRRP